LERRDLSEADRIFDTNLQRKWQILRGISEELLDSPEGWYKVVIDLDSRVVIGV
jgi:hypothetical protein